MSVSSHFQLIFTVVDTEPFSCCFQGFYRSGRFIFSFKVGPNYPHEPPKVKCETQVYHPNIDHQGNVCLNILREDWKPVLTINSIVYGLQYLFLVRFFKVTREVSHQYINYFLCNFFFILLPIEWISMK